MMALMGYVHGFIRQILSLLSLICIVFFASPMALWLKQSSEWEWAETSPQLFLWGMSSLLIVLSFMGVGGIIALIKKGSGLSPSDRWIGCALGGVKGVILALLLALGATLLPEHSKAHFREFHADLNDSIFVKISSPLARSSLSTFRSLREIKEHLKVPEKATSNFGHGDPWAQRTDSDKD
jgi:uncharacterized membrane protein required for colicin V production